MLSDHHPGPHPRVEVAVHPDDFRFREHDGNRAPARLCPVEGGIPRAGAMQVVQQAVGVQEFHRTPDWHDHDMRHVHTLLLIYLHYWQGHRPLGAGRRRLERHHDIAHALFWGEEEVLGVLFLPAHGMIDSHREFFLFDSCAREPRRPLDRAPPCWTTCHRTARHQAEEDEDGPGRLQARREHRALSHSILLALVAWTWPVRPRGN